MTVNRAEALRYMGQKGGKAPVNINLLFDECEKTLSELWKPRYTYRIFDTEFCGEGVKLAGTNLVLTGNDIKEHLDGCDRAALMCATLGTGADTAVKRLTLTDIAHGYAADALASAAVEQLCDSAEAEIKGNFPDSFFTWRFSPGYGDLPIELQEKFLLVTDARKRIGLTLSDGGMLIPSKSVTAVMGMSQDEIETKKRSCMSCSMYEKCGFRKEGKRCGA